MSNSKADVIYYGGPIVTMISDGHRVNALAVKDDKILRTGLREDVFALRGEGTKMVHLDGKCLMPGFIDPHSHVVTQSLKFGTANLDPKPIGKVGSIEDIKNILKEWIDKKPPESGQWVFGWGYDDTGMVDNRHPNRDDLDAVSTDHPILLMHISHHFLTGNSKMLKEAGITEAKPPQIHSRPDSNEPNGVLAETAMELALKVLPPLDEKNVKKLLKQGLSVYASAGITTAQDGATSPGSIGVLRTMAESGDLPIDVVAYPLYKCIKEDERGELHPDGKELLAKIAAYKGSTGRFRLGGIKLTVDGSIQGYTAYLSKPYYVQPSEDATMDDQCCGTGNAERVFFGSAHAPHGAIERLAGSGEGCGYTNMQQYEIDKWLARGDEYGLQTLVHTNGDAATDMLLKSIRKVRGDQPRKDLRTVIIHAQTMREDQLDVAAQHGLIPSFFPIHVIFWGDRHREVFLGPERARRISPAKSALDRGITFTLHHDAPVAGIGMLPIVSAAVNRMTSSGQLLGLEQRITPYQALRAITIDAAVQYFEEDRKGTLQAGKLADMVVLDADPLAIDPRQIASIRVLETIKEGVTIYLAA